MSDLRDRLRRLEDSFGPTPVVPVDDDHVRLFAKLEFENPNGSLKDRAAFWILKTGIERGDITERTTVVESSSGNFAVSMASFCHTLGIRFVPVIDPNCNAATEAYLRARCERVEKVTTRDATGGYLRTRLRRVQETRRTLERCYWPDQYSNTGALEANYRLTGAEIVAALPSLDYAFVGVGTGGTIAGLSRRLKESFPGIRVVAVDAAGSAVFGQRPRARRIPGIGSSIVPPLVRRAFIDDVVIVPERRTADGCRALLARGGIHAGGSSGSLYAAVQHYFTRRSVTGPRPSALFLCADRGAGYADTVYSDAWVDEFLGTDDDVTLMTTATPVPAG
ncbi:2,3-diaminopropionate biosynthesis protein SbnA [Streptomyces naphthomycinicus]|uniref:2,3-diaminopropionate biosynthesis protein SbnA n=1 Tax=Streptomyces naphthomycinicus TaxID=2872625 RepID=UPI001CEC87DD|nr:2,3-diaminopropionate biosynthesis protein SbnA [Streptomyces sp. TML10]